VVGFIVAGALSYRTTIGGPIAIGLGVIGALLGAQIGQRLAARRRRVSQHPRRR